MSETAIRHPQKGTIAMDRAFKFVFNSNMTATIRHAVAGDVVLSTLVASRKSIAKPSGRLVNYHRIQPRIEGHDGPFLRASND